MPFLDKCQMQTIAHNMTIWVSNKLSGSDKMISEWKKFIFMFVFLAENLKILKMSISPMYFWHTLNITYPQEHKGGIKKS